MATSGLGPLLVREGLLSESDRRTIAETCGHGSAAFAKGILAIGLLDEDELATLISVKTQHRRVAEDIQSVIDVSQLIAEHLLRNLEVVPLDFSDGELTIAMADPLDRDTLRQLQFFTGYRIRTLVATFSEINDALRKVLPKFEPKRSALAEFLTTHLPNAARSGGVTLPPAAPEKAITDPDDLDDADENAAAALIKRVQAKNAAKKEAAEVTSLPMEEVPADRTHESAASQAVAAEAEPIAPPTMDEFLADGNSAGLDAQMAEPDGSAEIEGEADPFASMGEEANDLEQMSAISDLDLGDGDPLVDGDLPAEPDVGLDPIAAATAATLAGGEGELPADGSSMDEAAFADELLDDAGGGPTDIAAVEEALAPDAGGDDLGLDDALLADARLADDVPEASAHGPEVDTGDLSGFDTPEETTEYKDVSSVMTPVPEVGRIDPLLAVATLNRALVSLSLASSAEKGLLVAGQAMKKSGITSGCLLIVNQGAIRGCRWDETSAPALSDIPTTAEAHLQAAPVTPLFKPAKPTSWFAKSDAFWTRTENLAACGAGLLSLPPEFDVHEGFAATTGEILKKLAKLS